MLAYDLRGSGTTAPPPRRSHARTYAYRGLPAFASLSMAGSEGSCRIGHAAIGPLPTMVRDGVSGVVFAPGNPEALLARVCQA
ncbi:MAG: hypothetical protein KA204_08330 [Chromatiaceae bacterium]|nr:hypothetical protein [Chromatiaceae bacterium]MBP6735074.1 hypothetical protein [Chromatiaceae bacterium]MBP8289235.1 hypothetical protein [Chromatiaceae bacterium]